MLIPDAGFEQPCCADCAEHNARGCPGASPFCVQDRHVALDHQIRKLQEGIGEMQRGVASVLPGGEYGDTLASMLVEYGEAAVARLESIRWVVDEANSVARPLKVERDIWSDPAAARERLRASSVGTKSTRTGEGT